MKLSTNVISNILASCRTTAVVGLSAKPNRASQGVSQYMQQHGYRIIPVNPVYAGTYILDEFCYATLGEAAKALSTDNHKIDLVNCFRQSEAISPIADDAIAIGARCLWMQLGIINEEAARKAMAAGLDVVMDRCLKIEHMRWQMQ
ncbi:MAG: CoA-binding protein [Burkholderiaceae bacterium]